MAETTEPSRLGPITPTLRERRASLSAQRDLRGSRYCRAWADEADAWLVELFDRATGGDPRGLALVAVGGFGRRELAPGSDLDLVLVHDGKRDKAALSQSAEALWYPVWDEGVSLDHSVRTPKQILAVAEQDLKVLLGLLDARHVAGDTAVSDAVAERALRLWQNQNRRWLPAVAQMVMARHEAEGDVAFLLEPDLKNGRGGLRDAQILRVAALATPVVAGLIDDVEFFEAAEQLLAVRVELQRPTARGLEQLLLEEQDRVAADLDFVDADALMATVSQSARTIAWVSDDGWRRIDSSLQGPVGRRSSADRPLERGLVLRDGEVTLAVGTDPSTDPSLALRAAALSAERSIFIGRSALERMASATIEVSDPWPPELLDALVRILGAGHAAIHPLETLDQRGLLVAILPEWAAVRNRPQRNAYHRFTVDRHLLETAANAAALVRDVARPDLLLIGAFLHDIGKGYPGDHTDVGQVLVATLATRMGFSPADVATLVSMVRFHLLLPDAATRRDLDDPATTRSVADAVGDVETLRLLAALSEADSIATGSAAWGPWKAGLQARLVELTAAVLAGDEDKVEAPVPTDEDRELMARGELAIVVRDTELSVVAPDRPGLLSMVAGVLALHGLEVRTAIVVVDDRLAPQDHAATGAGMVLQRFEVTPTFAQTPDWDQLLLDLEAAHDGRLSLDKRLAERDLMYRARRPPNPESDEVRVVVDNDASTRASVIEVRAPDAPAALYHIAKGLTNAGLSILWARVNTMGGAVVDVFYVRDDNRAKLAGDVLPQHLERVVMEALAR